MLRMSAMIAVVLLLSTPVASLANPDGPVGSVTLQPSFHLGPKSWTTGYADFGSGLTPVLTGRKQTWRAALQAILPVADKVTVGFEFGRSQDFREFSQVGQFSSATQGVNQLELFNDMTFTLRLHFQPGFSRR